MGFLAMVGSECLQESDLSLIYFSPKLLIWRKDHFYFFQIRLVLRALHHLYTKYSSEAPPQEGKIPFAVPMRSQDTAKSAGAGVGGAALFLQLHRFPELLNLTSTGASFSPSEN